MNSASKIIVLDRDGVINEDSPHYIKSLEEFVFIPGSIQAIVKLKKAGFVVAVATNQSGIGRGYFTLDTLHAMHEKIQSELQLFDTAIDGFAYCPHTPKDNCDCRKPKAGLFNQLEEKLQCSLKNGFVVGDSLRDLQAGMKKDMQPILVRTGKGEKTQAAGGLPEGTKVFESLESFVRFLL